MLLKNIHIQFYLFEKMLCEKLTFAKTCFNFDIRQGTAESQQEVSSNEDCDKIERMEAINSYFSC